MDLRDRKILVAVITSRFGTDSDDIDLIVRPDANVDNLTVLLKRLDLAGLSCIQVRANDHQAVRFTFSTPTQHVVHLDLSNDTRGRGSYGIRTEMLLRYGTHDDKYFDADRVYCVYRAGKKAHQNSSEVTLESACDGDVFQFYTPRTLKALRIPVKRSALLADWVSFLVAKTGRLAKQILFGFPSISPDDQLYKRRFRAATGNFSGGSFAHFRESPNHQKDPVDTFARYGARVLKLPARRQVTI